MKLIQLQLERKVSITKLIQLKPHRLITESKADIAGATQGDYHKLMHLKPHRLITENDVDTGEAT